MSVLYNYLWGYLAVWASWRNSKMRKCVTCELLFIPVFSLSPLVSHALYSVCECTACWDGLYGRITCLSFPWSHHGDHQNQNSNRSLIGICRFSSLSSCMLGSPGSGLTNATFQRTRHSWERQVHSTAKDRTGMSRDHLNLALPAGKEHVGSGVSLLPFSPQKHWGYRCAQMIADVSSYIDSGDLNLCLVFTW